MAAPLPRSPPLTRQRIPPPELVPPCRHFTSSFLQKTIHQPTISAEKLTEPLRKRSSREQMEIIEGDERTNGILSEQCC